MNYFLLLISLKNILGAILVKTEKIFKFAPLSKGFSFKRKEDVLKYKRE